MVVVTSDKAGPGAKEALDQPSGYETGNRQAQGKRPGSETRDKALGTQQRLVMEKEAASSVVALSRRSK